MMAAAVALSYWINRTRMGFYWTAVRGDQDAAESLGIDAPRFRLIAWLISVALFAFAGTFYAQYVLYINADRCMGADLSLEIAAMGVIGGWQTVFGPVLGAAVLAPVSEIIRARFGGGMGGVHLILYGLLLMVVILRMPGGLWEALDNAVQRRQRRAVSQALAEDRALTERGDPHSESPGAE
jgi:branched-chain amino acid transport system permease protein